MPDQSTHYQLSLPLGNEAVTRANYRALIEEVDDAIFSVDEKITNHAGSGGAAHANATSEAAGFMAAADKQKVDNLANDYAPKSHVGAGGAAHQNATTGQAGFMSAADKEKLNSIPAGGVPAGVILMWSGSAGTIPTGWALCDGQSGRPDLRDRFILGAGHDFAVGATGGERTHTLTISEMPAHGHSLTVATKNGDLTGDHDYDAYGAGVGTTLTAGNTGDGGAHENMPPYYALCFIIKT
jgi:hypothetical protein